MFIKLAAKTVKTKIKKIFGNKICELKSRLALLQHKCNNMIALDGEKLNESDNEIMLQLMMKCDSDVAKDFEPGSFKQFFLEQLLLYNKFEKQR